MLDQILAAAQPPEIFKPSALPFWEDEHISKQMLAAHLDPDFDGASRRPQFIDRSCRWIQAALPAAEYPRLLDLGCGPGLYAQRLAAAGYRVTGVDFSPRSIEYARRQAAAAGLPIDYRLQSYLELAVDGPYDAAMIIYCDYGALAPQNRARLLANARAALRPGGRLLLDVFTTTRLDGIEEVKRWQAFPKGGFWSADPHYALFLGRKYPGRVTLDQAVVVQANTVKTYYLWDQYYTARTLAAEAARAGFRVVGYYDDVTGAPYTGAADTLAVVLEKPKEGEG